MFNADLVDTFNRVVAAGLGTSTRGDLWTNTSGTNANWHTDGTFGYVAVQSSPGEWQNSGAACVNSSQTLTAQYPSIASGAGPEVVGLLARSIATSKGYLGALAVDASGNYFAALYKRQTGSGWTLLDSGTMFAGTTFKDYSVRFDVQGSSLKVKVWDPLVGEKSYWDIEWTDDTWSNSGLCGIAGVAFNAGDVGDVWKFWKYSKYDVSNKIVDSGWITDGNSMHQFAAPISVLANNTWYLLNNEIADTNGIKEESQALFLTSWTRPAQAAYTVTVDDMKATISWNNSTIDPDFNSWRVWRRYNIAASNDLDVNNTRNLWQLVFETRDGDTASFTYLDYLAPLAKNIDYVVTQSVDRNNSLLDSDIGGSFTTVKLTGTRYYFVPDVPLGTIASFEARNVTADTFTDDTEQQTILVIDRGNQVQIGTDIGLVGTLNFQLRDINTARADREFLTYLAKNGVGCFMKTPFGDVVYIKLSPIPVTRLAGVGQTDLSDLSVGYTEVYTSIVAVTR